MLKGDFCNLKWHKKPLRGSIIFGKLFFRSKKGSKNGGNMSGRIITISREFGSGGRTIGKMLAERLDIPCYDRVIMDQIAEKSGFSIEYIKEHGEYAAAPTALGNAFARYGISGLSLQDRIWQIQCELIRNAAEEGPCVIVGRCADYILRDRDDLLKVFIHASIEFRQYGETEEAPEKRLRDKDRRRKEYYRFYTDTEWGLVQNYDISLDSGRFGIDKCVGFLEGLYNHL